MKRMGNILATAASLCSFVLLTAVSFASIEKEMNEGEVVHLGMDIDLNGKHSAPQMMVRLGQEASVSMVERDGTGFEIRLKPTAVGTSAKLVAIRGTISEINGTRKSEVSSFTSVTQYGKSASISRTAGDHAPFSMTITPHLDSESLEAALEQADSGN